MVRTTHAGMPVPADQGASAARRVPSVSETAKRDRAASLAAFGPMLGGLAERNDTGPEGVAARASRQVNDPLGLASEQALTSPANGTPAVEPEADSSDSESGNRVAGSTLARSDADGQRIGSAKHTPAGLKGLPNRPGQRPDGRSVSDQNSSDRPGEPTSNSADGRTALARDAGQAARATGTGLRGAESGGAARAVQASAGATAGNAGGGSAGKGVVLPGQVVGSMKDARGLAAQNKPGAFSQVLRGQQAEAAPQIAKGLATLLMRKGGSVQIQLRPEALGRVRVDLTMSEGVVAARLEAETEPARQLLTQDIDRLRTMLEHRGLRVERLEVTSSQAERDGSATRDGETGHDPGRPGDHAGKDAGTGSPWNGGRRARGGDPGGGAERGPQITESVRTAEPGGSGMDAGGGSVWRSAGPVLVRLDAMA